MTDKDFAIAIDVLITLTNPHWNSNQLKLIEVYSEEYCEQNFFTSTIKILHRTVKETHSHKLKKIEPLREAIIHLNQLLDEKRLARRILERFGVDTYEESSNWEGIVIEVPQNQWQKKINQFFWIPKAIFSFVFDFFLLLPAAILVCLTLAKINMNRTRIKKNAIPILLIHGSGFNESCWLLGRLFLRKKNYGSVFSLNYDGLVTNDPLKGIDDYAEGKLSEKIIVIKKMTQQDEIILIGHSMGGLISSYYAQYQAVKDQVEVKHLISIASPWKGVPILKWLPNFLRAKRYDHMKINNAFLKELVSSARSSERRRERFYYNIASTADFIVPASMSLLTEDPRRQKIYNSLGHYGLLASFRVWYQIRKWLDCIYHPINNIKSL
jgi:pimeloyl-ACP methyl ester carboxylesterase